MDCKTTSTKARRRHANAGATLPEYLFGLGVGALVLAAVCAFSMQSSRNIASFALYSDLDQKNRQTLNQMVKDFRGIASVTNFATDAITCLEQDGTVLSYAYNKTNGTLTRTRGATVTQMLTNCSRLSFSMNMRNMSNGTFNFYPTTSTLECKAISVDWCCQRTLLGVNSDDQPQTATVMIRN